MRMVEILLNNKNMRKYIVILILFFLMGCEKGVEERYGDLEVYSTPPGAEVYIDGIYTNKKTDCVITDLYHGKHTLMLRKDSFYDYYTTVEIIGGELNSVFIELPEYGVGDLLITSEPQGARIYINGEPLRFKTEYLVQNLPVGFYWVRLTKDGYRNYETRIEVKEDTTVVIKAIMTPLN